jgi:FMN phosphatase YigB (HAD superfamily)
VVRQLHPIFSCPDSGWLLRPAYRHRLGGDEDADTHGIKIEDKDKKELAEKFSTMPPHAEVPAALRKLRDAGFRLFTFTDNLLEVQTRQLEHGGIVDLFERRFTADGETLQAVARGVRLCRESLRSSVLSPATHGTPSAPSRRAARQR